MRVRRPGVMRANAQFQSYPHPFLTQNNNLSFCDGAPVRAGGEFFMGRLRIETAESKGPDEAVCHAQLQGKARLSRYLRQRSMLEAIIARIGSDALAVRDEHKTPQSKYLRLSMALDLRIWRLQAQIFRRGGERQAELAGIRTAFKLWKSEFAHMEDLCFGAPLSEVDLECAIPAGGVQ